MLLSVDLIGLANAIQILLNMNLRICLASCEQIFFNGEKIWHMKEKT